ncbi:MAG: hypothetical protein ACREP6_16230 [Candidatus Binataceae bacterium]
MLVAGGSDGGSPFLQTTEPYDPANGGSFSAGPHALATTALLQNGTVLIAGGNKAAGLITGFIDLYTP